MGEKLSDEKMKYLMTSLNEIAYDLCKMHSITCCIDQYPRHFYFQCKFESMPIIFSYHNNDFMIIYMEAAEEYTSLMGILEIYKFVKKNVRGSLEPAIFALLKLCFKHFCRRSYVFEYYSNLVSVKERLNSLQEDEEKDGEEKVENPPPPYSPCFYDSDSDYEQHASACAGHAREGVCPQIRGAGSIS
jgi:hypothetical protein